MIEITTNNSMSVKAYIHFVMTVLPDCRRVNTGHYIQGTILSSRAVVGYSMVGVIGSVGSGVIAETLQDPIGLPFLISVGAVVVLGIFAWFWIRNSYKVCFENLTFTT